MFWKSIFWKSPFWQTGIFTTSAENISFNWYGLFNSKVLTLFVSRNYWSINYNKSARPWDDGDIFLSSYNSWVTFEVDFVIKGASDYEVDQKLDELTTELSFKEGIFKFLSSWIFREIKATMTNISIKERTQVYILWTITFNSCEPYWYNSIEEQTNIKNQTTSPFIIQVNNNSLKTYPKIYISFNSASWVNNISIDYNDRNITFAWNIATNDILVIDTLNKEVLLNNVLQDYSWTFQYLEKWVNSLLFTINWTFNANVNILHRLNYLLP